MATEGSGFIDDAYSEASSIIDGLPEGDVLERYGFEDAVSFVNYVEENLVLGEEDIGRVLEVFENGKCPMCEDLDGVDATLESSTGAESQGSFRKDKDDVVVGYFEVDCGTSEHDVFWRYEERWYED